MSQVMERTGERLVWRTVHGKHVTVGMRLRFGNTVATVVDIWTASPIEFEGRVMVPAMRFMFMRHPNHVGLRRVALSDAQPYRVMHRGGKPVEFMRDVEAYRGAR